MSDRIDQLAAKVGEQLPDLILGMRERIEAAINDAVETAHEDDAKAVLRIPVAIKWDLDSTEAEIAATVSTRFKATVTVMLDDPNQSKLELEGGSDE